MSTKSAKTLAVRIGTLFALGGALTVAACGGDDPTPDPTNTACGGIAGLTCPAGLFCDFAGGSCGQGDNLGACHAIPETCTLECVATCGCDGKSYCNPCAAHAAGIDDAADLICDGPPPQ